MILPQCLYAYLFRVGESSVLANPIVFDRLVSLDNKLPIAGDPDLQKALLGG